MCQGPIASKWQSHLAAAACLTTQSPNHSAAGLDSFYLLSGVQCGESHLGPIQVGMEMGIITESPQSAGGRRSYLPRVPTQSIAEASMRRDHDSDDR